MKYVFLILLDDMDRKNMYMYSTLLPSTPHFNFHLTFHLHQSCSTRDMCDGELTQTVTELVRARLRCSIGQRVNLWTVLIIGI